MGIPFRLHAPLQDGETEEIIPLWKRLHVLIHRLSTRSTFLFTGFPLHQPQFCLHSLLQRSFVDSNESTAGPDRSGGASEKRFPIVNEYYNPTPIYKRMGISGGVCGQRAVPAHSDLLRQLCMIQTVTWWGQRPDQFANVRIQKRFLWFFFVVVGYILERVAAHPSAVEVTGNPAMSAESAHPDKWHEGKDLVALPLDREDELPGLDRLKARELNLLKDVVRRHQQFCLWVGPHPTSKSRAVRKEQANIFPHRTRGPHQLVQYSFELAKPSLVLRFGVDTPMCPFIPNGAS